MFLPGMHRGLCDPYSSVPLVSRDSSNSRASFRNGENNCLLDFVSLCHLLAPSGSQSSGKYSSNSLGPGSCDHPESKSQTGMGHRATHSIDSIYPSPRAASIPKQTTFSPAGYRIKLPYWSITVSKVLGKMLNHPPPYNTYTHPAPHPATLTDIRVWAAAQPAKCHFLCLLVYKYEDIRKFHSKTFIAQ